MYSNTIVVIIIIALFLWYAIMSLCKSKESFASTYPIKPLSTIYYEKNSPIRCGPCAEQLHKNIHNDICYVSNEPNPIYKFPGCIL